MTGQRAEAEMLPLFPMSVYRDGYPNGGNRNDSLYWPRLRRLLLFRFQFGDLILCVLSNCGLKLSIICIPRQ